MSFTIPAFVGERYHYAWVSVQLIANLVLHSGNFVFIPPFSFGKSA